MSEPWITRITRTWKCCNPLIPPACGGTKGGVYGACCCSRDGSSRPRYVQRDVPSRLQLLICIPLCSPAVRENGVPRYENDAKPRFLNPKMVRIGNGGAVPRRLSSALHFLDKWLWTGPSLAMMTVDRLREIAALPGVQYNVKRLDAFGSTAKGTARPSSDVDLLVEFNRPDFDPARRFFGLLHALEDVLGCHVDLLTVSGLKNPYFKKRVLQERVLIYEG